ncbi:hypothetical protein RHO12_01730 [Orbus sturtevantii]|uniref:hypothetical protein n=1 Tax=Orbus sturtevantii TaxID=3074109 RepID=UPI00370D3EB8
MSNLNTNQSNKTAKSIIALCFVAILLFLLSLASLIVSLANRNQISNNHHIAASNFTELETKLNAYYTMMDTITALEQRMNQIELEQKKIMVDYDNLNTRTARHEQDIGLLQTIVNDKNLDSRLDNIEVNVKNTEVDIDSIKTVQRAQQLSLDDIIGAFTEFKSQIIQKISSMLSHQNTKTVYSSASAAKKNISKVTNFPYLLSSIEYRSGEKWAVLSPKNNASLSELKFLNVGSLVDNWRVLNIENQSVKLINGQQIYTLTIEQ